MRLGVVSDFDLPGYIMGNDKFTEKKIIKILFISLPFLIAKHPRMNDTT